ncbi:serine/threonine protein kinase [Heliorestis convoluta]|uniref:Serine/threonine protein kinase n=1 Tax=Heliorestis convoluta TaxID=356322 RepID=A0A5Q2MYN2_9FIRM|nr:serine/threonine-protein kinase [Heliorestis convoluta]QGG46489.1 serine/threonine protein kinase [Heliorestis convoluta]
MAKAKKKNKKKLLEATLADGTTLFYEQEVLGEGSEGVVHFTEDRKSVVKFYKDLNDSKDPERRRRIENIVYKYNPTLHPESGDYWKSLYCWPAAVVVAPRLGVLVPAYPSTFFTKDGREKKLSWFISPRTRNLISKEERGDWLGHLKIAIMMARATRRLHSAGLAHSDLSYNNFLADPVIGTVNMIDLDSLVVPEVYPPSVAGTPGLIAPEVIMGQGAPSIRTDLHALAVLVYQTLLFRHPLRGPKINSTLSAEEDEKLSMGAKALFIEHPHDQSNRPQGTFTSFERLGTYLAELINKSFVKYLHEPDYRPTAADWEQALIRTTDLIHPCSNSQCELQWFVYGATCPGCGQKMTHHPVPLLQFYKEQRGKPGHFINERRQLIVWPGLYLYKWHVFDHIRAGENADKTPQGYFHYHENRWYLYNLDMDAQLIEKGIQKTIPRKQFIPLQEGQQIRLSTETHGRIVYVQMLNQS